MWLELQDWEKEVDAKSENETRIMPPSLVTNYVKKMDFYNGWFRFARVK